jgi:type I restriction enzyme S subunit
MRIELKQVLCPQPKSKIKASDGKLEGKYKFFTSSPMQTRFIDEANYDKPSLIFGTGGNASVHFCDEPFSTSTDCLVMYGRNKIELESIYNYLKGNISLLEHGFKGAGLKHISKDYILAIEIELPSEAMQHEFLQKNRIVDEIIEAKRTQLLLSEELVKSRFIEMFGDPKRNPRKWDMVTVGDIATDVRYGTSRPATEGGKYPYLRMNNLTYEGYLDLTDLKHIDIPDNEVEKCVVRNGDVLFNRTNSVELVGKTCVYNLDSDMIIAGYIIRVRIDDRVLPVILSSYLNSTVMKEQLRSMAKGAVNQANINAQELRSIPIYLPPITLQHEFATFVEQVDKSKFYIIQMQILLRLLIRVIQQKTTEVLL